MVTVLSAALGVSLFELPPAVIVVITVVVVVAVVEPVVIQHSVIDVLDHHTAQVVF